MSQDVMYNELFLNFPFILYKNQICNHRLQNIQTQIVMYTLFIVLKHYAWKICLETTRDYNDTMEILENRMTEIRESYDSKNQGE